MARNPIETMANLEDRATIRFQAHGETVEGVASFKTVEDDRILLTVTEREGTRIFIIETQWANGWLDPQVDAGDPADPTPRLEPVGSLEYIEVAE